MTELEMWQKVLLRLSDYDTGFRKTTQPIPLGRIPSLLEELSPREFRVFRMRFLESLTQKETGKALGISPALVAQIQRKGFRKLLYRNFVEIARESLAAGDREIILGKPIEEIDCSVRTYNILKNWGVGTVGEVLSITLDQRAKMPRKSMAELQEIIDHMGLQFPS